MANETPRLEPISLSRTRTRSPSRSFISRLSRPSSLRHVYSAQHFDDHAAYSRRTSPVDREVPADSESVYSESGSEHDLENAKTKKHEDRGAKSGEEEVEMEVIDGIQSERDVEKYPVPDNLSSGKEAKDPNLVTWTGPDDPLNPKNWRMRKKWAATFIVSSFTFISPVSSSMVAPGLAIMSRDLGVHTDFEAAMILSIFVLAYAVGPLFLGPLSEVYGRVPVLQISNMWYLVWNLGCGFAKTGPQMMVFRFMAGLGGSAPLAIGGAVLGDCFSPEQRGKAIAIYTLAPLLGPAVGPIAGGFIVANTTWRWVFWATTILDAMIQVSGFFFLQETYAPTLLKKRAAELNKESDTKPFYTEYDTGDRTLVNILSTAFFRPFRLLFTQPIIQAIALYMACLYGLMYLMLSTFPKLWTKQYGESVGTGSLNYLSMGIGFFCGSQITAPINDRIYRHLKKKNNGVGRPEFRVPLMFLGSAFIPVGLFWYGWSADADIHWIMPNIGAAIFCAGCIVCFQSMQTYIVDSYSMYAASGIAAAVVLRSLAGFGFPLFAPSMFEALGYGWGNSLLGFIAIGVGMPSPFLFWMFGERLRARSKFAAG